MVVTTSLGEAERNYNYVTLISAGGYKTKMNWFIKAPRLSAVHGLGGSPT